MVGELLRVEVVYALPMRQTVLPVSVTAGSTVEQAIAQSGMLRRFPEIADRPLVVGIYSRPVTLQTVLQGENGLRFIDRWWRIRVRCVSSAPIEPRPKGVAIQ